MSNHQPNKSNPSHTHTICRIKLSNTARFQSRISKKHVKWQKKKETKKRQTLTPALTHSLTHSLAGWLTHSSTRSPFTEHDFSDVPELFEGDMALTNEQKLVFESSYSRQKPKVEDEAQSRGAISLERALWPNGIIPYDMSSIGRNHVI